MVILSNKVTMKTIDILKQQHTVLMTMDGYTEHQGLQDYTQINLSMYDKSSSLLYFSRLVINVIPILINPPV